MSQSQRPSQSQVTSVPRSTAIKFVKYMLNNSLSKIPIKRVDLTTHVLGGNSKAFSACLQQAQEILLEIYGSKIVQIPNKTPPQYICVSTLDPASELEHTPAQKKNMSLLFLVLSFIFMKGGSINEEAIRQFLKKLGISLNEPHNYFGNVKKLLTETYPKQLYLSREKHVAEGKIEAEFLYSWGFRSEVEFPKKTVLALVAEILQKPAVCFGQQYQEIYGEENLNMETD